MGSKLVVVFLSAMLCHGCAKKPQGAPPPAPDRPAQAAPRPQALRPDAAGGPALQGKPEALPPLTPFADGKRVRIKPLEADIKALEITVPANFKLTVERLEDIPPSAHLTSPALEIAVGPPEAGFFTLKQEMRIVGNSEKAPTFFRADETEDGFLLVHRDWLTGDHPLYNATISRGACQHRGCGRYRKGRQRELEG